MTLLWTLHAEAPAEDLQVISGAVLSHVRSQAFDPDASPLACLVHEGDTLIAGGSGRTECQRLFVHYLWVAEEHRRAGLGSRILQELEAEAARRGCRDAIIETLDDSVATLYRQLGYHSIAHVTNYLGPCHRHILLKPHLSHRQ
ncbi:MAG: GNAT family N-acetyltransferase [Cyanobacteriota bacterium]|jgi:GNAT superfamily N-acetyltransferase